MLPEGKQHTLMTNTNHNISTIKKLKNKNKNKNIWPSDFLESFTTQVLSDTFWKNPNKLSTERV